MEAELISEIKKFSDTASARLDEIHQQQNLLKEQVREIEQKQACGSHAVPRTSGVLTFNKDFLNEESFAKFRSRAVQSTEHYNLAQGIKTLVGVDTGDSPASAFPVAPDRAAGAYYQGGMRQLRLLNLLPALPVSSNRYEFAQLNSGGDAAAQADEGDEKAEVSFDGQLASTPIATIAVHTTASAQVLDDVAGLDALLQRIMTYKVQDKLEASLITGSGTAGNINGLYTQAIAITTTQTKPADRIGEAQYKMQNDGYEPNVVLLNPADWFAINVTDNLQEDYVYGSPAVPRPNSLWGMPVVTSPSVPVGRALIGDTNQANFLDRMQPTLYLTRDHKDYATRNLVLILVELRAGLALYDALAFRRVDLEAHSG